MPNYWQIEELAALLSPAVRQKIDAGGISLVAYGEVG
jgi:hypothetical protein